MKYKCILILVTVCFFSCGKDSDDSQLNSPPALQLTSFPLTIGNKWEYYSESHLTDSIGNNLSDQYYLSRWEVISDTTIDGINCSKIFQTDSMYGGNIDSSFTYYANEPDGFYAIAVEGFGSLFLFRKTISETMLNSFGMNYSIPDTVFVPDTSIQLMKFPSALNDEWFSHEYNVPLPHLAKRRWIGLETITTPAGTFSCVKLKFFRTDLSDFYAYQYFSTKGLVMEEYFVNNLVFTGGVTANLHRVSKLTSVNF